MARLLELIRLPLYLVLGVVLAPFVWDKNHDGVRDE